MESAFNEMIEMTTDIAERRNSIIALEEIIGQAEQLEMPVNHHFGGGVYVRELHIPAGTVLTGKIHKTETMNILMKGDISIATENGSKRIQAPSIFVTQPGIKKAGYAHTDTIFLNVHATEETDPEKIESEFIANDYSELEHETVDKLEGDK